MAGCHLIVAPVSAQGPLVETERPWLLESEFDASPDLHALEGQTVLLHLEPAERPGKGSSGPPEQAPGIFQHNRFRFLVERERAFRFCIPAEEPHLSRLQLFSASQPKKLLIQARPGGDCDAVTLQPGSYRVDVTHDARGVRDGRTAFLRLPDATRLTGDPLTAGTATLDFLTWKDPSGIFITVPNGNGNLVASATEVDKYTVWQITHGSGGTFKMYDGVGGAVKNQLVLGLDCPPQLFVGPDRSSQLEDCDSRQLDFHFAGANATRFHLVGEFTDYDGYVDDAGFVLNGSSEVVGLQFPGNNGTAWTVGYRGFSCASGSCGATELQLQAGEVALFAGENYQGAAIVFAADIPDFSIYSGAAALGLGMGDEQAMSVRVGPDTLVLLYADNNFGGATLGTIEDVPSLAGLSVGPGQLSSLQIEVPRSYVVDSNGCAYCDLTGIDLSALDLSGADFRGANLTSADLTGTILFGATLDDANLSNTSIDGADFIDASLRCTNLSDNDLTTASFAVGNDAIVAVSDEGIPAILGVDPVTGGRAILSGAGIGGGEALSSPKGLAATAEGLLLVDESRLLRVQDGERTLVSSGDQGSGLGFLAPTDVAVGADGSIFVSDVARQAVVAVDPDSGDRTVVSSSRVGNGPIFVEPFALTVSDEGVIYVADTQDLRVISVDQTTGDRSIVSDGITGSGPVLQSPAGIVVDVDGSILLVDSVIRAVLRIDPETGDRSLVSGGGTGGGTEFSLPTGITLKPNGVILVVDPLLPALFEVDPETGDREVRSDPGTGSGPDFLTPVDVALTASASLSSRIATDFSCRLNLARSTFDIDTVPSELWRYLDLTGATIHGAQDATLSTADDPLDLSGTILSGVNLSGVVLDGVNLGCATTSSGAPVCARLQSTTLNNASLKAATMSSAQLQGATLSGANLDGADLANAKLLGLTSGSPANLSGAFMRGVDLSRADLSGVIANHVNFYSIAGGGTADASNAVMTGAKFNNAYMAGADFSGATLQSTEWTQAVLVGANFTRADLSKNATAGEITDFGDAYLHGAVFANASVIDANFNGSYWDLGSATTTLNIQLPSSNLGFVGYWHDPSEPECVQATYPNSNYPSPSTPATDSSNTCPDGGLGDSVTGCQGRWDSAPIHINAATPPGAVAPALPGSCTSTDFLWLFD